MRSSDARIGRIEIRDSRDTPQIRQSIQISARWLELSIASNSRTLRVSARRSSLPLFVSYVPFTFIDFADPVIGTNYCLPKAAWSGRCGSPSAGRIRVTRQQVRGIFNGMRLARISPAQRCSVNLNDGNCSFIELHYLSRLRDARLAAGFQLR